MDGEIINAAGVSRTPWGGKTAKRSAVVWSLQGL